jgi:hypothetical protein
MTGWSIGEIEQLLLGKEVILRGESFTHIFFMIDASLKCMNHSRAACTLNPNPFLCFQPTVAAFSLIYLTVTTVSLAARGLLARIRDPADDTYLD